MQIETHLVISSYSLKKGKTVSPRMIRAPIPMPIKEKSNDMVNAFLSDLFSLKINVFCRMKFTVIPMGADMKCALTCGKLNSLVKNQNIARSIEVATREVSPNFNFGMMKPVANSLAFPNSKLLLKLVKLLRSFISVQVPSYHRLLESISSVAYMN